MELETTTKLIEEFIQKQTEGFSGVVLGLSGGIDSSTVAHLSVRALGKDKVFGLCLPYDNQEYQSGKKIAELLGIGYKVINIKELGDAAFSHKDILLQTYLKVIS